jgi:hypothetical protein
VYEPAGANPLAFLLGLAWLLAVSIRLAVRPGRDLDPGPASGPASGEAAEAAEARAVVSA